MRRGTAPLMAKEIELRIATTMIAERVPTRLAVTIARQLILKNDVNNVARLHESIWSLVGQQLNDEVEECRQRLQLTERQIVAALPKVSPAQLRTVIETLGMEVKVTRTLLHAAIRSVNPIIESARLAGRYQAAYDELQGVDATLRRVVAAAAARTRDPKERAKEYLESYQALIADLRGSSKLAKTLAFHSFSSANPIETARKRLDTYSAVVRDVESSGVDRSIARTVANRTMTRNDPLKAAQDFRRNYQLALRHLERVEASVARTIALAACRWSDPIRKANEYRQNYRKIVRFVRQREPTLARRVAARSFMSKTPELTATRCLAKLLANLKQSGSNVIIIGALAASMFAGTVLTPRTELRHDRDLNCAA